MSERQVTKELQNKIDKYLGRVELLLIDVPRHVRNDYVNELEDYLLSDYQNTYDSTSSKKENIDRFISGLEAPEKIVQEFLVDNNLEKFAHKSLQHSIISSFKTKLNQQPLRIISVIGSLLGVFGLLPVIFISNASIDSSTGNSRLGPLLLVLFLILLLALLVGILKLIEPNNWFLRIVSVPLFIVFVILPFYILENLYLIIFGSSYSQLTVSNETKGFTFVELPYSGLVHIDQNAFFLDVVGLILFLFCVFFVLSTFLFIILKGSYRSAIKKRFFWLHVLGSLVVIIFIFSIFTPPLSVDRNIGIGPTKEPGSYYVSGIDLLSNNYRAIETNIQKGGKFEVSSSPGYYSIYHLTSPNSNPQLVNVFPPSQNILTANIIQWVLPYKTKTALQSHINQENGSFINGYAISMKIIGNLYFEYRVANSSFKQQNMSYLTLVYSLSTFDLLYISSNQSPHTYGLGNIAYITAWYLWKADIYSTPYKYPVYYPLLNLLVIAVTYCALVYYIEYMLKKVRS